MTKSGIVIPDTAKEKPQEGRSSPSAPAVSSTTASASRWTSRPGQVLYAKYAGTEFKVDGEELLIVSQQDILAIVEG